MTISENFTGRKKTLNRSRSCSEVDEQHGVRILVVRDLMLTSLLTHGLRYSPQATRLVQTPTLVRKWWARVLPEALPHEAVGTGGKGKSIN